MSDSDDYVYDEESGEWMPASELAVRKAAASQVEVRDAVGNLLQDGDSVALIKDLEVKGAGKTLKVGTVIKSIRLTSDPQEIDCRHESIKGLVLRAEFVRKR
ncbi:Protein PhnA [uncultured Sphingopyxis sp.]|uniref:Protein PhnA n=1 Tax=uncultured Sphingopyxis sp. TaxID=310581 RepID=A0A1Y5Q2L5_9SPHN|nr:alkylphosphonate utilization protein [uncultured Sphingopyxis sp.]SBV35055.1 Protein PhnA [uncultured Sphingopyxis sp.]